MDTKQKIIKAAFKLFSQKGYLGATTKEIAKLANVAEVTLFRYFKTKEQLFIEVLQRESFLPTLKDLIPKLENIEYKEALKTVAQYYLNLLKKKRELIRIMHTEISQYPVQIRKIHTKIIQEISQTFAFFLDTLKEKGVIRNIDTNYASMAYFGMLFNLFIKRELLRKNINIHKALDTYIDIFYEGTRRIK